MYPEPLADMIVGTVATVPKGTELYIRSIAVRPDARGLGNGSRLVNAVEAFAVAHRNRRLLLNTAPFLLAAVQLYESHGFGTPVSSRIFSERSCSRWRRTSRPIERHGRTG
jgi:ribosomal protein S18 acetylase RimI-like enzyme